MELRHLRYFIAVAEELNFSRAAEKLHVSQPPLSRQIQDLEDELQVRLFERTRQSVRVTRVGRLVLARARKIIQEAEALRAEAMLAEREAEDELQIGYAPSPTAGVISRILSRFHELLPGPRITLHDMTHSEMVSGLRTKKLNVALTFRPKSAETRGLKFDCIQRYAVGIVCSVSSPFARQLVVDPKLFRNSELVVYSKKGFPEYHQWVSKILGVKEDKLKISEECNDALSLVAGVESGRGVAVVGHFITAIAGERVRFVPFEAGEHFLDVGLLYRSSRPSENEKKFIEAALGVRAADSRKP